MGISGPPDPDFARAAALNPVLRAAIWVLSSKVRGQAKKLGVRYQFLFMRASGDQLREVAALVESGAIAPVVGKTVPFDQIPQALAALAAGGTRGKVVATR